MKKPPLPVVLVSCLFVAAGIAGIVYHLPEWRAANGLHAKEAWAVAVRLLAIVCGVFLFFGKNWARCLAIGWMMYHVVLSAFHSTSELVTHLVLLVVVVVLLFRPASGRYFIGSNARGNPG